LTVTKLRLHARIQILERQDIVVDQFLDFNRQGETVLNVMTLCPSMEGTKEVRPPPRWQFLRYRRRCSGLDQVPLKQRGKQLRIFHRNRIILRCFLSLVMWIDLRTSLSSRLTFHHIHFLVFFFELPAGTLSLTNRPSRTPSSNCTPIPTISAKFLGVLPTIFTY
jgi:hypothetical protein